MTFITKYRLLFVILFSILSLTAVAQTKKTVAVLDPICRDNTVNTFFRQMVRGAMESAVTNSEEYEAYDRSAFDLIQKEHAFQQSGVVNDSQIKKMGEMVGVDYVLVAEMSSFEGYISLVIKILNVTTGKYDKTVDDYTQLAPESVKQLCEKMVSTLFGGVNTALLSDDNKISESILMATEEMPEYPGGPEALGEFLSKEIRYPKIALDNGITGTVLVEFVVEKDGSVSNAKVKVPLFPECDKEAVRGVMSMPKWKPGKNGLGYPVRCIYQVPINFRSNNPKK